jgi:hypothetical protein
MPPSETPAPGTCTSERIRPPLAAEPGAVGVPLPQPAATSKERAAADIRILPDDFRVREDGRDVAVDSLAEVSSETRNDARTVVLVLDDTAVDAPLTPVVQKIARMFVSRMGVSVKLSVVRFNDRSDEAVSGRERSLERIDAYTAGAVPFFGRDTLENALTKVAKISTPFEAIEHRRKTIVAIASPRVFDVQQPPQRESSLLWDYWVSALTSASRANVSVYVVDPEGITGHVLRCPQSGSMSWT